MCEKPAPLPDYTTGPVPTYEEFSAAHQAGGGFMKPDRYSWDSVDDTCRRKLMAIATDDPRYCIKSEKPDSITNN